MNTWQHLKPGWFLHLKVSDMNISLAIDHQPDSIKQSLKNQQKSVSSFARELLMV